MDTQSTADKYRQLVAQYPFASAQELAKALGISRARIYQLMRSEGVKPQRQTIPKATP